jgi:DNA-binding NarL/FixJ family response regulator
MVRFGAEHIFGLFGQEPTSGVLPGTMLTGSWKMKVAGSQILDGNQIWCTFIILDLEPCGVLRMQQGRSTINNLSSMSLNPISLALLDDQSLFRKVLKNFLITQSNLDVAVEATDVLDLISQLKRTPVDILLLDIFLPGVHGIDAVRLIRDKYPSVRILVLSASTDMDLISSMLDSGVHGYISKGDEPEELIRAIQAIAQNRLYRNTLLTEAMYWSKQNAVSIDSNRSQVTVNERESKILQLLWGEKSNREIADELFLGIRTVERIRQDLKEKVGAKSTIGLIKFAVREGIITTPESRVRPGQNAKVAAGYRG